MEHVFECQVSSRFSGSLACLEEQARLLEIGVDTSCRADLRAPRALRDHEKDLAPFVIGRATRVQRASAAQQHALDARRVVS